MKKRNAFTPTYWTHLKAQLRGQMSPQIRERVTRELGIEIEFLVRHSLRFELMIQLQALNEKT